MPEADPKAGVFDKLPEHAAITFALRCMCDNSWLHNLVKLIPEGAPVGDLEGDPGWNLERRDPGSTHPYYATWPDWAVFRATVDPMMFDHPERFYTRDEFLLHVHAGIAACPAAWPCGQPDRTPRDHRVAPARAGPSVNA